MTAALIVSLSEVRHRRAALDHLRRALTHLDTVENSPTAEVRDEMEALERQVLAVEVACCVCCLLFPVTVIVGDERRSEPSVVLCEECSASIERVQP